MLTTDQNQKVRGMKRERKILQCTSLLLSRYLVLRSSLVKSCSIFFGGGTHARLGHGASRTDPRQKSEKRKTKKPSKKSSYGIPSK